MFVIRGGKTQLRATFQQNTFFQVDVKVLGRDATLALWVLGTCLNATVWLKFQCWHNWTDKKIASIYTNNTP